MIRDASSHRRCGPASDGGETRMWRAKIIDRTDQVHPMLQRQRVTRQRSPSACQRGQPLTECRIEPLDVGRVDDPVSLRAPSERLHACRRAIDNAALDVDDTPLRIALHDLSEADVAPRTQPRPSALPRVYGLAKRLPHSPDIGHQAVRTDQQGTVGCTALHALDQPPDQDHITLLADLAAEPQARADHQGQ